MEETRFREICSANQERVALSALIGGLVQVVIRNIENITINNVLDELVNESYHLNIFKKYLNIDDGLLDRPIVQITELISFDGTLLSSFVEKERKKQDRVEKLHQNDLKEKQELEILYPEDKIKQIHSKITFKNVKMIEDFDQFLNELGFSDENEKELIRETEIAHDYADGLFNIYDGHIAAFDDLEYQLSQTENKEREKYLKEQIKALRKFLKLCPKDLYI